jgi:integrase
MRGSLRLRHAVNCPARSGGKTKDARSCRCAPVVQGRVGNVQRQLGYLELGWRVADLVTFERQLADLRDQILTGRTPKPTRIVTLDEFVGPWFEKIAAQVEVSRMSPLTFNQYEGVWRRHLRPTFGRLPIGAINQPLITRYMRAKLAEGLSESTVKNSLVPLCGMLTDAVTEGLIPSNPLRAPKRARHRGGGRHDILDLQVKRPPPKYLETSEALRLLDAVPGEHLDMVLLALTTGFRRNELLGLQWEWIDFGTQRIDLRGQLYWKRLGDTRNREPVIVKCKYESEREVPLYRGVAQLLGPRRQATGFVFVHPRTGEPWRDTQAAHQFLGKAYERADLRRAGRMWHQLRHTYASTLAAGGVKRHEVEQLMGHRAAGTTSIYTHLFREAYEDVERVLEDVYGAWLRGRERPMPPRDAKNSTPRRRARPDAPSAVLMGHLDAGGHERRPAASEAAKRGETCPAGPQLPQNLAVQYCAHSEPRKVDPTSLPRRSRDRER